MIDLTPLEVRQKKGDFRRAVRGYDPELVNDFLDLVADRMEELVRENLALRDAAESVHGEIAAYRQKEQALSDALMTAQKLREEARQHAEKEVELLVREARLQADTVRDEVARQMVREEEALRGLRARRTQLVESFRRLLDREIAELDIIEETLGLGPPAQGAAPDSARPAVADAPADVATDVATDGAAEVEAVAATDPWEGPTEREQEWGKEPEKAREPEKEKRAETTPEGGPQEATDPAEAADPRSTRRDDDPAHEDWLSSLIEE